MKNLTPHYLLTFRREDAMFSTAVLADSVLGSAFRHFMMKTPPAVAGTYVATDSMYLTLEYILGPDTLQHASLVKVKCRDLNAALDKHWAGELRFVRLPREKAPRVDELHENEGDIVSLAEKRQQSNSPAPASIDHWLLTLAKGKRPGYALVVSHGDTKIAENLAKSLRILGKNTGKQEMLCVDDAESPITVEELKHLIANEPLIVREGFSLKAEPTPAVVIISTQEPEKYEGRRFLHIGSPSLG